MQTALRHLSLTELEQGRAEVLASPTDLGRLEAIVVRPAPNERRTLGSAVLTPERGIEGDRWATDPPPRGSEGQPDPRNQVSLMNSRILRQIAVEEGAVCLAGDNLIVDLDVSESNLPTGSRLSIGESVVLEITEIPHTGCNSFAARYGDDARAFINNTQGRELHLRGRYARIVVGGTITAGDAVRKASALAS
jgi:MOSC domain-containing protein YiiM